MTDAFKTSLQQLGVPEKNIRFEKWWWHIDSIIYKSLLGQIVIEDFLQSLNKISDSKFENSFIEFLEGNCAKNL